MDKDTYIKPTFRLPDQQEIEKAQYSLSLENKLLRAKIKELEAERGMLLAALQPTADFARRIIDAITVVWSDTENISQGNMTPLKVVQHAEKALFDRTYARTWLRPEITDRMLDQLRNLTEASQKALERRKEQSCGPTEQQGIKTTARKKRNTQHRKIMKRFLTSIKR